MTSIYSLSRTVLLSAAGLSVLAAADAHAQADCSDQINALRSAAADAPQAVEDRAAFETALENAQGWYEDGNRVNCQGWLDEAESLLAPADEAPAAENQTGSDAASEARRRREQAEREAEAAAEEARERAAEARERAQAQAEAARERREENREAARERAEAAREAQQAGDDYSRSEADGAPDRTGRAAEADRTAAERRARAAREDANRETESEDREGWLDRRVDGDEEARTDGAAEITEDEGFDARIDPEPVEGARDRLSVIDSADYARSGDALGEAKAFTASVNADLSPAIPAVSQMSDLERSARRRLVAGPDTTIAEISARTTTRARRFTRTASSSDTGSSDTGGALAVEAVRFNADTAAMTRAARRAVRQAAAAVDGSQMIAVRGDSSDARFADRAGRLVRALAEEGVSRDRVEVIWGRTYGDTPERLELAVMPAGGRY